MATESTLDECIQEAEAGEEEEARLYNTKNDIHKSELMLIQNETKRNEKIKQERYPKKIQKRTHEYIF
jgi:hypothetical protein